MWRRPTKSLIDHKDYYKDMTLIAGCGAFAVFIQDKIRDFGLFFVTNDVFTSKTNHR
jgi:hypothetical protein